MRRAAWRPAASRWSGPGGARAAPLVAPPDRSGYRALPARVPGLGDDDCAGALWQRRRDVAHARPAANRHGADPDLERVALPRANAEPLPPPRHRTEREHLAAHPPPARHEAAAVAVRASLAVAQLEALHAQVVPREREVGWDEREEPPAVPIGDASPHARVTHGLRRAADLRPIRRLQIE